MTTKRKTMVNSYGDKRAPWEIRQAAFLEWLEAAPEGIAMYNYNMERLDDHFNGLSVVYDDSIVTNLTFTNSLEGDS